MNLVVRGTVDGAFTAAGLADGDIRIFPADRCIWEQTVDSNGGYSIDNAAFVGLTHTADGNGVYIQLTSATLGFIGKSGRFVEMA